MTEEQIKQNAKKHASSPSSYKGTTYSDVYAAFIAGAHSRDEEIEEMKKQLAAMTRFKNSFAGGVDILDNDNKELQDELNQLRNPWISVEDRLPEDGQQILEAYTLECTASGNKSINEEVLFSCYRGKFVCDGKEMNYGIGKSKSTTHHWMPAPELPK